MQIEIKDPALAAYIAALIINGPDEYEWRIRKKIEIHFPGGIDAVKEYVDEKERSELFRYIWSELEKENYSSTGGSEQWFTVLKDIAGYTVEYSSKGITVGCKLFSKETIEKMLEACHD